MADNQMTQKHGVVTSPEALRSSGDVAASSPDLGISFSKNIREVVGELSSEGKTSGVSGQQSVATKTPQERKEELLARLPKEQEKAERLMRRQVDGNLKQQLHDLEKKLEHGDSFFDMNNVMARIREFRDILGQLATMAFEQLKAVWLRFVYNLSV